MKIVFKKSSISDTGNHLDNYLASLSSPIDSFLEEHILESKFFKIFIGSEDAGYFAVHEETMLTQFYMPDEFRMYGQKIFAEMKRVLSVGSAFVPTCDEFFLTHATDSYRTLDKQAYFFCDSKRKLNGKTGLTLKAAEFTDIGSIKENSGDFFDEIEKKVGRGIIYIAARDAVTVGYGIIEKGRILKDHASIGMFTIEKFRQQGIGRGIIIGLKKLSYEQGLRPIAGCWYYNHNSKKTLESAGMITNTRLLRFGF